MRRAAPASQVLLLIAAAMLGALGLSVPLACGSGNKASACDGNRGSSIIVTVEDATNGSPICNATVHVSAPPPEHDAQLQGCYDAATYDVVGASPATYVLAISAPGYASPPPVKIYVPHVGGACPEAKTQTYTAKLQPEPGGGPGDAGKDGG